jgi:hypothetical protein
MNQDFVDLLRTVVDHVAQQDDRRRRNAGLKGPGRGPGAGARVTSGAGHTRLVFPPLKPLEWSAECPGRLSPRRPRLPQP